MKFPLHVEPDQECHGQCLCIVDAAGTIIARSPAVEEYGSIEQVPDQYNLSWIVEAANAARAAGVS